MTDNALPDSWTRVALSHIGDWQGGGTPRKSEDSYWGGEIPWVSPKDMKVQRIRDTQDQITPQAIEESAAKLIPEQSVLLVTRSGILAHSLPVATTDTSVTINQDLKAVTPYSGVDPTFLAWVLRAEAHRILTECSKDGTTVHSIEMPRLYDFEIPLAPTKEQLRIVAKIDQLFSELDNGIENLKTARQQLAVYRQALLKHAFEGKLTAQWREENPDKVEDPEKLLKRVKDARANNHHKRVESWKKTVARWEAEGKPGRKPTKPRAPKSLSNLNDNTRRDLPQAPDGWTWDRLGWITCGVEYGTSAKSDKSGRVPVLRMGNLQNGYIDWSDLVYSSDDEEIERYRLRDGDVLFNRTNSPELVGKTANYRGKREAIFAGYLIRINQISGVIDSQYLNLFLNSYVAKQYGNQVKTDGVNQSNINGQKLMNYPFPYCSPDEQREIVRRLDQKISIVDQISAELEHYLKQSEALRQSILKKAFSGQLAPQHSADEPASIPLKRIQAEQSNANTKKRKTGT